MHYPFKVKEMSKYISLGVKLGLCAQLVLSRDVAQLIWRIKGIH